MAKSATTPAAWLAKWGANLNAATAAYKTGVMSVQTAPGQAAAAKQDKYQAGLMAAITSGKWARNTAAVSLGDWQSATTTKGVANLPSGIAQAQKTKTAAITKMLADTAAAVQAVSSMPTDTLQQRIAKSQAYMLARAAAAAQG